MGVVPATFNKSRLVKWISLDSLSFFNVNHWQGGSFYFAAHSFKEK